MEIRGKQNNSDDDDKDDKDGGGYDYAFIKCRI